ncbi:hypothetical protein LX36DRAFT_705108, partial [Colletotrichum falcatum]
MGGGPIGEAPRAWHCASHRGRVQESCYCWPRVPAANQKTNHPDHGDAAGSVWACCGTRRRPDPGHGTSNSRCGRRRHRGYHARCCLQQGVLGRAVRVPERELDCFPPQPGDQDGRWRAPARDPGLGIVNVDGGTNRSSREQPARSKRRALRPGDSIVLFTLIRRFSGAASLPRIPRAQHDGACFSSGITSLVDAHR